MITTKNVLLTINNRYVKHYKEKGLPLPDECKPGYAIKQLTEEEREVLKTCTAKDFNHRRK